MNWLMQTIGDLLLKYAIPGVREAQIRKVCAEEISKLTGYTLDSKQIKYKEGELFLSIPSVLKSALLMRQPELISKLAQQNITIRKIT